MDNDNTGRRIADSRRSLLDYEEMAAPNRSSDPDSGYRTSTPEPSAFIANLDSPHLPRSPALHPNITTRARNRNHRRFSDLFSLRSRTPTFDGDHRPKISRPIVNQGDIDVPHNGPYIYNHPSRPRLDVEIPRSSFSDLWGQRYGPVGDDGYNIDARPSPRVTRSMDFDLLVEPRENQSAMTRGTDNQALGRIRDWYAAGMPGFVAPADANEPPAEFDVDDGEAEDEAEFEGEDDMDASYLMPLVSPCPESSSSSTTSASLPSISDLLARPRSTFVRGEQESHLFLQPSPAVLEEQEIEEPAALVSELSERWIRHPLRQNPPTFTPPLPPAPPSSPVTPSPPSTSVDTWSHLRGFRPHCGVTITSVGDDEGALVENFTLERFPADPYAMRNSTVAIPHGSSGTGLGAGQRASSLEALEADGFLGSPSSGRAQSTAESRAQTPSRQRRPSEGGATTAGRKGSNEAGNSTNSSIKSFCCGLFGDTKKEPQARPNISAPTPIPQPTVVVPTAHATILEEDEDDDEDDAEEPDDVQERQPPRIIVEQDEGYYGHGRSGIGDEGVRRRHSVRHSWVTVSRWLE